MRLLPVQLALFTWIYLFPAIAHGYDSQKGDAEETLSTNSLTSWPEHFDSEPPSDHSLRPPLDESLQSGLTGWHDSTTRCFTIVDNSGSYQLYYDEDGRTIIIVDSRGAIRTFHRDANGHIISETYANHTTAPAIDYFYNWDESGHLLEVHASCDQATTQLLPAAGSSQLNGVTRSTGSFGALLTPNRQTSYTNPKK